MEDGFVKKEKISYWEVKFGAIRQKCDRSHPDAEIRTWESGDKSGEAVEIVHPALVAKLIAVKLYQHKKFGNTWTLMCQLSSGKKYALQFKEDSHYGSDLLKKLPNLSIGERYLIKPFKFKNDEDSKWFNEGTTFLKLPEEEKITSYYHETKQLKNKKFETTYKNGLTPFKGEWSDNEEVKIHFMKELKFLRTEAISWMEANPPVEDTQTPEIEDTKETPEEEQVY